MLVMKDSLIKNAGLGVFARRDIKRGQVVCYYDGAIVTQLDFREIIN